MQNEKDNGWLARTVEKLRKVVGLGENSYHEPVKEHSNKGVATPDRGSVATSNRKDINFTNVEAAENRNLRSAPGLSSGIHASNEMKKTPQDHIAALEKYQRQIDKDVTRNNERVAKEIKHIQENPYKGAVREATTGKMISRVNSEEKYAKGIEQEKKAPVKQNVMLM